MSVLKSTIGAIALCSAVSANAAAANPPLREVARVDDGLLYVAIANEIRKNCDEISARFGQGIQTLRGLNRYARDLGYSQFEIDAFTDSEFEKDRLRARGALYYSAHGVDTTKPEDFCRLGRAEINKNSAIGVLLRAK